MKRTLIVLTGIVVLTTVARATLLVDEPFSYSDGALTEVSSGAWSNHSGSTLQVDVQSGKVNLTRNENEDVNRGIPGSPYGTNGYLYASFTVNFSELPTGSYFAHLKDAGTINFKARVFATTAGAGANNFRVGIANGGNTSTNIPFDLALNTTYTLVVRWDTTNATSTLWINPASETSTANRADATDVTGNVPIIAFALRQGTTTGQGHMGTLQFDDLKIGTAFSDVVLAGNPATNPPVVSAIGDQSIPMNGSTPAIPFTVNDGETDPANLVITVASSNPTLVPTNNIVLGGSGTDRTITVTPVANQQGTATLTVTVTDGDNNSTTRSFTVIVGAPSISAVPNQITQVNTPTTAIPFTVGDAETAPESLTVSGYSSNPALVPNANIVFGGSGSNRTAVITPAAGQSGTTVIHFVVSDGSSSVSNRFILTVAPVLAPDLNETFTYADGLVQTVSSFVWDVYSPSPATNDCYVIGEQLFLSQTNQDDIRAFIGFGDPDGYYDTNSGYVVYYSLKMNLVTLPTGSGSYFALLKDNGTFNFRARLFVSTNGAAPGAYRVGIANGTATTTMYVPTDLAPQSTYTVTVRYNVATAETRLWLNATSETSSGVEATDTVAPVDIWNFAFRQSSGVGQVFVDDLKVGTSFADVYQAPNWPPTISDIADQTTPYQTATPAIPFTIGDAETAAASLTLSATSTNLDLVPVSNISFGGSGANRTITVTPVAGQSGTTLITVTVTDAGGNTARESFLLTVLEPNNPPFISPIPNQVTSDGVPTPAIPFTVYDLETDADSLVLGRSSSNPTLVPEANIVFGGSGSNRTVTVTPVAGQFGTAAITVTVSDSVHTSSNTFLLTVNLSLVLADDFTYADGSIVTNSGFFWTNQSGAAGSALVTGGRLELTGTRTEDIKAALTNAPYYPSNNPVLYAGFTVNFSALPGKDYFAHFSDAGTGFRGRVYTSLSNAAPGAFRLAVANSVSAGSFTNMPFPLDLSLGTPYRVVLRYHVGTGVSTLWINATNEADFSITATDAASPITVFNFAFRQSSSIGTLTVDDLLVGTTFDTVKGEIPLPSPVLSISRTDNVIRLAWPAAASAAGYGLQVNTNLNNLANWQTPGLPVETQGDQSVVNLTNATGHAFFRLAK